MRRIIVQAPTSARATPTKLALVTGQSATFGVCHCGACLLDLRINAEGAPPLVGRVTATDHFWLFSNLSERHPMTIENMDDWYQYIVVEPGRQDVPVPFELTQIDLTPSPTGPKVSVFGYEPRYNGLPRRPSACERAVSSRPLLDRGATYFAVLNELCERRLGGNMDAVLPTSAEIADRLRRRQRRISARAVDAHVKYVMDKLGLPKGASREALVTVIIRSGLLHHRV